MNTIKIIDSVNGLKPFINKVEFIKTKNSTISKKANSLIVQYFDMANAGIINVGDIYQRTLRNGDLALLINTSARTQESYSFTNLTIFKQDGGVRSKHTAITDLKNKTWEFTKTVIDNGKVMKREISQKLFSKTSEGLKLEQVSTRKFTPEKTERIAEVKLDRNLLDSVKQILNNLEHTKKTLPNGNIEYKHSENWTNLSYLNPEWY